MNINVIKVFNETIDYIETVLDNKIDEKKISQISGYSYPMFSRLFSILTGYSLSEYIRLRRLTRAAFDLRKKGEKVIDTAFKYQYESPDSFSAAFKKYHNCTPMAIKQGKEFKIFTPIHLSLTIKGGKSGEIIFKKKEAFTVAGIKTENIRATEFPKTWEKLLKKINFTKLNEISDGTSYGICYNSNNSNFINYIAAFEIKNIDEAKKLGLDIMEIPELEYAVIQLKGKSLSCIHKTWKCRREIFLAKQDYEYTNAPNFSIYNEDGLESDNYEMELWIPLEKIK